MTDRAATQAIAHDHAPSRPIAQDPAGTGARGVNSALGPNAGNSPLCFPPEPSGLVGKI